MNKNIYKTKLKIYAIHLCSNVHVYGCKNLLACGTTKNYETESNFTSEYPVSTFIIKYPMHSETF